MIFQGPESKEAQLLRDFLRPIKSIAHAPATTPSFTVTIGVDELMERLSRVFTLGTRAELDTVKRDNAALERERDDLRAILWMIATALGTQGELVLAGGVPTVPEGFAVEARGASGETVHVKATVAGVAHDGGV